MNHASCPHSTTIASSSMSSSLRGSYRTGCTCLTDFRDHTRQAATRAKLETTASIPSNGEAETGMPETRGDDRTEMSTECAASPGEAYSFTAAALVLEAPGENDVPVPQGLAGVGVVVCVVAINRQHTDASQAPTHSLLLSTREVPEGQTKLIQEGAGVVVKVGAGVVVAVVVAHGVVVTVLTIF